MIGCEGGATGADGEGRHHNRHEGSAHWFGSACAWPVVYAGRCGRTTKSSLTQERASCHDVRTVATYVKEFDPQ